MTEAYLRAAIVAWWVPWLLGWVLFPWDAAVAPRAVLEIERAIHAPIRLAEPLGWLATAVQLGATFGLLTRRPWGRRLLHTYLAVHLAALALAGPGPGYPVAGFLAGGETVVAGFLVALVSTTRLSRRYRDAY